VESQKLLKKISGQNWYHQRFDGAPLYILLVAVGELKKEKRKPSGTEADIRVSFFSETGKSDWYLDMRDIKRGSEKIIQIAKRDPQISVKLLRLWKADEKKFADFFNQYKHFPVDTLSDKKLIDLYKKYYQLFINRVSSSAIIDHFALGTDEYIAAMLRKEVGHLKQESQFTEIFSIATAPMHQSFINKAETDLLKIAFAKHPDDKIVNGYREKYFWINNNYFHAQKLSVAYFVSEIKKWRQSKEDLKAKYDLLRQTALTNKKKKMKLFKQYNFSPLLKTLLKISEDFTYWQDERKKSTFLGIHLGDKILSEMAGRRGIKSNLVKYLLPDEVVSWFSKGTPTAVELETRQSGCLVVMERDCQTVLTGDDMKEAKEAMFPDKKQDEVKDVRGLSASVGRVRGNVKVINSAREVGKIEAGDILVAVMTRPDYIAGIKKAAAIVTNEGGITCHAAIVARELGIPCLIGTKIATEIFKDGDLVEVNANHGVATLIKT